MSVHISDIAKKYRRALRNETGTKFTLEELQALVDIGSYDLIMRAEAEEIATWRKKTPLTQSGNIGSTSEGMAAPGISGRSLDIPQSIGQSYIEALSNGI